MQFLKKFFHGFLLGEETALVNVSISKGGLKCQRAMLSENWGTMSFVGILAAAFTPL